MKEKEKEKPCKKEKFTVYYSRIEQVEGVMTVEGVEEIIKGYSPAHVLLEASIKMQEGKEEGEVRMLNPYVVKHRRYGRKTLYPYKFLIIDKQVEKEVVEGLAAAK